MSNSKLNFFQQNKHYLLFEILDHLRGHLTIKI